jgi:lysophospholipase L1-like esterase
MAAVLIHSRFMQNALLALSTTVVALCASIAGIELYGNYEYWRWRQDYSVKYSEAFQTLTIASPNQTLLWEYRPKAPGPGIKTNSYGFRDLEAHTPTKPDGVYRVAFVGDSVTVGLGEEFDSIFVREFEDAANNIPGLIRRIQALNFAIDGYNTVQVFEMIRARVFQFSPDKIVYLMCLNDFDFTDGSGAKIRFFRKPSSFFLERVDRFIRQRRAVDYHVHHFARNKDRVFSEITQMKILLDQRRVQFMIAIIPIFPTSITDFDSYGLVPLHVEIKRFLKARQIQTVDLLDRFLQEKGSPALYSQDIYHPNKTGHSIIAQGLLQPILSQLRGGDAG